jgi:ribonuclease HII
MTFSYENKKIKQGYQYIIGCDEVGRGSLAGPVVATAVVFNRLKIENRKLKIREIKDSKLLSPEVRGRLSETIKNSAYWSVGVVSQNIIDEINIHNAALLAMRRAVEGLGLPFDSDALAQDDSDNVLVAVDGKFTIPNINISQEAIVDGDNKIISIAAASIIAKVYRDDLMRYQHERYPIYNFAQHKGYGTEQHREAIAKHGLSPLHRLSFCKNFAVS